MTIETDDVVRDIELPSLTLDEGPARTETPVADAVAEAPVGVAVAGVPVEDLVVGLVRLAGDGLSSVARAGGALKSGNAHAAQAVNAVTQLSRSVVDGLRRLPGLVAPPPQPEAPVDQKPVD